MFKKKHKGESPVIADLAAPIVPIALEDKNPSYERGYRDGMIRAHREVLEMAAHCKTNNSSLTSVGIERIAWGLHNLSKDSAL